MNAQDFCFWLQGYFEIADDIDSDPSLTEKQVETIKNHLNLVFKQRQENLSYIPQVVVDPTITTTVNPSTTIC